MLTFPRSIHLVKQPLDSNGSTSRLQYLLILALGEASDSVERTGKPEIGIFRREEHQEGILLLLEFKMPFKRNKFYHLLSLIITALSCY